MRGKALSHYTKMRPKDDGVSCGVVPGLERAEVLGAAGLDDLRISVSARQADILSILSTEY